MTDGTATQDPQATAATQAPPQAASTNGDGGGIATKLFPTKDAAMARKPKDASKNHKPYQLSKAGKLVGWVWARGYDQALAIAAKREGYTCSLGGSQPVTTEAATAKVLEMDDEAWKALVAARKAVKKN
jgi:hypothetical protein